MSAHQPPGVAALDRHLHRLHDVPPLAHPRRASDRAHPLVVARPRARGTRSRRTAFRRSGRSSSCGSRPRGARRGSRARCPRGSACTPRAARAAARSVVRIASLRPAAGPGASAGRIRWRWVPRPSIPSSTTSPAFRKVGGLHAQATPAGVPVLMTSPGSSVMNCAHVGHEVAHVEDHLRRCCSSAGSRR